MYVPDMASYRKALDAAGIKEQFLSLINTRLAAGDLTEAFVIEQAKKVGVNVARVKIDVEGTPMQVAKACAVCGAKSTPKGKRLLTCGKCFEVCCKKWAGVWRGAGTDSLLASPQVFYCSSNCQKLHWTQGHRRECRGKGKSKQKKAQKKERK